MIQSDKKVWSYDDYGKQNGDIQNITLNLNIPINESQELLKDYLNSGKKNGWKLGDDYNFSKYDLELSELQSQQESEVKSDKPKRDRKSKPRVDYSKSEDEDLSFEKIIDEMICTNHGLLYKKFWKIFINSHFNSCLNHSIYNVIKIRRSASA